MRNNEVSAEYNGNHSDDCYCTAIDKIVLDHKDLIYKSII